MPYSVPPPAPPPVVNFLQPEELTHSAPAGLGEAVRPMGTAQSPTIAPPRTVPQTAAPRALPSAAPPESSTVEPAVANRATPSSNRASATAARAAELGTPLERDAAADWRSVRFPRASLRASPALDALSQSQPPSQPQLRSPSQFPADSLPSLPGQPSAPASPVLIPVIPPPVTPPSTPSTDATPEPAAPEVPPTIVAPDTDLPATDPSITDPSATDLPETPAPNSAPPAAPTDASGTGAIVELDADRQEFDTIREVFTGEGNAEMRFRGAVLTADRVQVNLVNRIAVAEGNAQLTRGDQVLRGDRFEYNFVQTQGIVLRASGEVFLPSASTDFASTLSTDTSAGAAPPVAGVSSSGGISFGLGNSNNAPSGGTLSRLRFEADRVDFTTDGWVASNVRITNDPFSPPELELRATTATFTRLSPTRSEIRARNPRLVFDQGFTLPLLRNRVILDNRERESALFQFGFDEEDRGGLFVESVLTPLSTPAVQLQIRPQVFLQRAFTDSSSLFELRNFGIVSVLSATLTPTTSLEGNLVLTGLEPENFNENLRASLRARQLVGRHTLSLEYSYRDRLFNGSLGYQNVQSSLGFVVTSPNMALGTSGINFSYQAGAQLVTANTDRLDLLDPIRDNDRITLGRYQISAAANRPIFLWVGTALPATPTEGLRYTPNPITPYLALIPSTRAVVGLYSNGDSQGTLTGSLTLAGQFGNFSRPFLDFTAFNLTYSQSLISDESPFLFDRDVDQRVISAGIVQQIYGPFRLGIQTSINLDRNQSIDTDYTLEYSRRAYAITLRYNPERQIGSLGLRISDFNWGTAPEPFSGSGGTISGGVRRSGD